HIRKLMPEAPESKVRGRVGAIGFSGKAGDTLVKSLSGGEKARLLLGLATFYGPNMIILDEPTNHLDMATKEMLIKALSEYEGSMLFVSHDRHFLSALSNRVLELTPEGLHTYGGGYTEYVARTGR
ncbi:ATP-binding cassette domain-containing protein, partial [Escherichia coli]